ncbi:HWE histidine kinase domain-containing protein [Neorhizobium sp. NCHU2750]|uniref:sensor histidine kinase n=1 Tax=Neorhizobium sp. NCHU2750 TaxID=1825976 RepID=UPI000EB72EFB|nr:histidine kinase [Neorhizobium sp. NCHU2750]
MTGAEVTVDRPTILMLEDSPLDAELIREHLERMDPQPEILRAENRSGFVSALEAGRFDLILADFSLPDFDGMSALEMAHRDAPDIPFIFVSGVLGEEVAIESFRRGATDYVLKQRLIRLPAAVERALKEAREKAEYRRVQQQKELLVRELSHRVKNTMAMVMSLVRRTAKNSTTVENYSQNLLGRLRAMADAHALLFETNWSQAELVEVVRRTLAPYVQGKGERFRTTPGPLVMLNPKAALAFSMVINELTTNAVKYGALAHDAGYVKVGWTVVDGVVTLEWTEVDGPAVVPPEEEGFGTTLIQRSINYELQGEVEMDYAETGLTCTIRFPISAVG